MNPVFSTIIAHDRSVPSKRFPCITKAGHSNALIDHKQLSDRQLKYARLGCCLGENENRHEMFMRLNLTYFG